MKIVQVIADAGPGGAPVHVRDLIRGLATLPNKSDLILIAPPGWLAEEVRDLATICPVNFPNAWANQIQTELADAIQRFWEETEKPPLLHFHGVRAGIAGRLALEKRWPNQRLPVIYTEHLWTANYHLPSRLRELAQLHLLRRCDRLTSKTIAVSHAVADFLLAKKITTPEKLVVIPHGVALPGRTKSGAGILNIGVRDKIALDSRFPIPDTKNATKVSYRLGTIGSLVPLKGYRYLIEAMPLILQNLPQTVLEIIGEGPEHHRLADQIRHLGLNEHVRLLGSGATLNLADKCASWDIFVSSSLSESFGLAIAEAMAAGCPVVATRVGAVPELVTNETGRLVAPRDSHELAKAITDLLPRAETLRQLGTAGRAQIANRFRLTEMVNQTATLYQEVFGSAV